MAAAARKTRCIICEKEKATVKCSGCSKDFCFNHLVEHRQQLGKRLDELENKRNSFRQTLTEQITNPQKYSLIKQINQWENDSMNKIRQTAHEARQILLKHAGEHINEIEIKSNKLTKELKQIRDENDFNEIDLNEFKKKLNKLQEQLNKPSNISIQQDSSPFINKISVLTTYGKLFVPNININAKWIQNGITLAGSNGQGTGLNQLSKPYGVYIDDDQTIYVADYSNHRIVEWKNGATSGQVVADGNGAGSRNDQLYGPVNVTVDKEKDSLIICDYQNRRVMRWPRRNGRSGETIIPNVGCWGLTMDNDGYFYVSDRDKHEVRRWKMRETNTIVAGGNGKGNRLDQLDQPYYIFVDQDHSVYVSDSDNHRVMKWIKDAKQGIVVAGGKGAGNGLTQLSYPRGVIVDQLGTLYVVDCNNQRVMRWLKGATQGSVIIGGSGPGGQPNQLNVPMDLSFDQQNNLYVVDCNNHRVQKFHINSH